MYSLVLLSYCSSFWKNQNHHISIIIIITIIWILIQTTCSQDTYNGSEGLFFLLCRIFSRKYFKLCLQHDLGEDGQIRASIRDYLSGIVHSYQQKPAVRNRYYRHCHSTRDKANKYVCTKRSVVKGMEIKPNRSVNEVQTQMNAKNQWKHTSQATHTWAMLIVFSMSSKCHDPWTRRWSRLKK